MHDPTQRMDETLRDSNHGSLPLTAHRVIEVPRPVRRLSREHRLLSTMCPTAAGVSIRAREQLVSCANGCAEMIVLLCTAGSGFCEMTERRHPVAAGDAMFIPARTPYEYGASPADPWSIVWVHAVGSDVRRFMRQLAVSARSPKVRGVTDELGGASLHRVYEVLEQGFDPSRLIASAAALRSSLAEMLLIGNRSGAAPSSSQPVTRVIEWMRNHLDQQPSVAELAQLAAVSPSYLSTLFKRATGHPPLEYFTRLRIRKSCSLLLTTTASIKEIAVSVGYADPYYFSRCFRRVMATSPRAYRAAG